MARTSAQDARSRDVTQDSSEGCKTAAPGSQPWLRGLIQLAVDPLHELRLAVMLTPDGDVTLDLTGARWYWRRDDDRHCASTAMRDLRKRGSTYAPIVVLTEGRTDAELPSAALTLLYPHQTDLGSFLDYDTKPKAARARSYG